MLDSDLVSIDSIPLWVATNFPNNNDLIEDGFSLTWDIKTPIDSISKVTMKVIEGYESHWEKLSQEKFSKSFCELDNLELDTLISIFPFKFRIAAGSLIPNLMISEIDTLELETKIE